MSQPIRPAVSLCIPSCRPDGLRKLLEHIANLDYQGPLSVIVVDNDADRPGEPIMRAMSKFPFPLSSVAEPRRGRTYAYNAGFAAASRVPGTDYVAVLDDDAYPSTAWLTELTVAALRHEADIVGGPVLPVFEDPGHWLASSGLYAPRRYVTGPVEMIYGAGNMLIRRDVLAHYLDGPSAHAFAGGGDLDFFSRCRKDGRSFAWADDARAFETVPRSRTTVSWLLLRGFRSGTDGDPPRSQFRARDRRHRVALVERRWPLRLRDCAVAVGRPARPLRRRRQPGGGGARRRPHRGRVQPALRGIPLTLS